MKISICIPTVEYEGKGVECLQYSFEKMKEQTFKDFDVIISDHSKNHKIEKLCEKWKDVLNIQYFRNEEMRGNPAFNSTKAMSLAKGEWIKFLCQDDYLLYPDSLEVIASNLGNENNWMATGYLHTKDRMNYFNYHAPQMNPQIYVVNTIGTPSCCIFRNITPFPPFDEKLSYVYDCDFYFRYALEYGMPKLINTPTIANYIWDNSITANVTEEIINAENVYVIEKAQKLIENRTPKYNPPSN